LDIGQWLRDLGLQSYEQAFRDHGVDLDVLCRLTAEDLKEIGVSAVGHRRKILHAVAELAAARSQAADAKVPHRAERRHLTVMFCDLVALRRYPPASTRRICGNCCDVYFARVDDVAGRHGGFVAKYLGDGALIYFGYPKLRRTTLSGRSGRGSRWVDSVSELTAAGERLSARVGNRYGVGGDWRPCWRGRSARTWIAGETPNLAARLQGLAENGAVVIAETTRRILGDLFELSALAPSSLKGFAQPILAWRVIGEGRAESRFEALHGTRVTPTRRPRRGTRPRAVALAASKGRGGHVALIQANPALASRGWYLRSANGFRESRRRCSATRARHITPTVRSSPRHAARAGGGIRKE